MTYSCPTMTLPSCPVKARMVSRSSAIMDSSADAIAIFALASRESNRREFPAVLGGGLCSRYEIGIDKAPLRAFRARTWEERRQDPLSGTGSPSGIVSQRRFGRGAGLDTSAPDCAPVLDRRAGTDVPARQVLQSPQWWAARLGALIAAYIVVS